LFRYENKTRSKTNLLVFLRPYVMRTTTATDRLTQDRYDFIRGQQQNFVSPNMVVRELNTPVLPPADAPTAPFVDPRYNGPVPGPVPLAPGNRRRPHPRRRPCRSRYSGRSRRPLPARARKVEHHGNRYASDGTRRDRNATRSPVADGGAAGLVHVLARSTAADRAPAPRRTRSLGQPQDLAGRAGRGGARARRVASARAGTAELEAAMSDAYNRQDGTAAQVVGEVEGEVDLSRLMQDIPAVEDLLESEDDAPIIRMINALLTQAAREQASDIHIEPFESHRSCVSAWTARCATWCVRRRRCTAR
jgi:hypothetical protein